MKKADVPQQGGLNAGCREVSYAVDSDGHYTLEPSDGWEVKNIALRQAWAAIADQLRAVLAEIEAGKQSCLAYYMVRQQMDPQLLSQYSGVARWRVKRHLKPALFAKLDAAALRPYTELFGISAEQLRQLPEQPLQPLAEFDQIVSDKP
jgi:hypothetical protein